MARTYRHMGMGKYKARLREFERTELAAWRQDPDREYHELNSLRREFNEDLKKDPDIRKAYKAWDRWNFFDYTIHVERKFKLNTKFEDSLAKEDIDEFENNFWLCGCVACTEYYDAYQQGMNAGFKALWGQGWLDFMNE